MIRACAHLEHRMESDVPGSKVNMDTLREPRSPKRRQIQLMERQRAILEQTVRRAQSA